MPATGAPVAPGGGAGASAVTSDAPIGLAGAGCWADVHPVNTRAAPSSTVARTAEDSGTSGTTSSGE